VAVARVPSVLAAERGEKARPGCRVVLALERDGFSSSRHPALSFCLNMIFLGKPVPTFPDHALAGQILPSDLYQAGSAIRAVNQVQQREHDRTSLFDQ